MAITASLRFEILRRDGFACTYCGAKAPEAVLHVDHVVPVALGGNDDPSNLTTACEDCNAGKGSTSLDAPTVAEVDAKQLQWRTAIAQAAQESLEVPPEVRKAITGAEEAFEGIYQLDSRELERLAKYVTDGLPADAVIDAAWIARHTTRVPVRDMAAYMFGICRKRLESIHTRAREIISKEEGR